MRSASVRTWPASLIFSFWLKSAELTMRLRSKRILAKQKTTRYAGVSKKLYIKITFPYNRGAQATIEERKGDFMSKANSAAHTKWTCKYHIVFTPKYRRKIIYNQYKADLARILHDLCAYVRVGGKRPLQSRIKRAIFGRIKRANRM